ncbi:MAG: hypothetical protein M3066_08425 [Actinomycetota bacterium]|nr:hypothetical protein [Actinomycetota bacterium]
MAELTPAQWADPEAVAARFVLVDTSYSAADDPAGVAARRAFYAAPRLAEDLRSSSSGAARLQDLRRQHGVFAGEVLTVVTTERRDNLAVVAVDARLTLTSDGSAHDELRSYQLTMALDSSAGHWLVAGVEES